MHLFDLEDYQEIIFDWHVKRGSDTEAERYFDGRMRIKIRRREVADNDKALLTEDFKADEGVSPDVVFFLETGPVKTTLKYVTGNISGANYYGKFYAKLTRFLEN